MADIRSIIAFGFGVPRVSGGFIFKVILNALGRSFGLDVGRRDFALRSAGRSFSLNAEERGFILTVGG